DNCIGAHALAKDIHAISSGEIARRSSPRMVRVRVRDDGPVYRTPGVDEEVAGRTKQAAVGVDNQFFWHASNVVRRSYETQAGNFFTSFGAPNFKLHISVSP